jgi:hypothetical protein
MDIQRQHNVEQSAIIQLIQQMPHASWMGPKGSLPQQERVGAKARPTGQAARIQCVARQAGANRHAGGPAPPGRPRDGPAAAAARNYRHQHGDDRSAHAGRWRRHGDAEEGGDNRAGADLRQLPAREARSRQGAALLYADVHQARAPPPHHRRRQGGLGRSHARDDRGPVRPESRRDERVDQRPHGNPDGHADDAPADAVDGDADSAQLRRPAPDEPGHSR